MTRPLARSLPVLLLALAAPAAAGEWKARTPMAVARSEIAVAAQGGHLYVAGGIERFGITERAEVYDVAADRWSELAPLPRELHHVAMSACDGSVWTSGGYTTLWFTHDDEPRLWRLAGDGERWIDDAQLPGPLGEHAMTCLEDTVLLVGGRTPEGATGALLLRDEDAAGGWRPLAPMPTPRHSFALAWHAGELWVLGGRNEEGGAHLDVVESYDPGRDAWRARPPLPIGRGGLAAAELAGRLHVFGGEQLDEGEVLGAHHVLDDEAMRWVEAEPVAEPRHGLAAAVVDGRLFAVGGGASAGWRTIYSVTPTLQEWVD